MDARENIRILSYILCAFYFDAVIFWTNLPRHKLYGSQLFFFLIVVFNVGNNDILIIRCQRQI